MLRSSSNNVAINSRRRRSVPLRNRLAQRTIEGERVEDNVVGFELRTLGGASITKNVSCGTLLHPSCSYCNSSLADSISNNSVKRSTSS